MSVIDPQTWRDAEDGRALRELRDALPDSHFAEVFIAPKGYQVRVFRMGWGHDEERDVVVKSGYATISKAADDCREALK